MLTRMAWWLLHFAGQGYFILQMGSVVGPAPAQPALLIQAAGVLAAISAILVVTHQVTGDFIKRNWSNIALLMWMYLLAMIAVLIIDPWVLIQPGSSGASYRLNPFLAFTPSWFWFGTWAVGHKLPELQRARDWLWSLGYWVVWLGIEAAWLQQLTTPRFMG